MEPYLLLLLGSSVDEFYEAEYWPKEGTYAGTVDNGRKAGGPPLNMGCVCASKGGNVKGLDFLSDSQESSEFIVKTMESYGVDMSHVVYGKAVNGKVIILNTGEKRTMFVVHPERPAYEVDTSMQELLNNASYIYSMMHMIRRSFKDLDPLLQAKKHGAKILLDGSSEFDQDWEKDILYTLADGLFINTEDYENLKRASSKDPKEILFEKGCGFVCITDGENGASCYTKDRTYRAEACPCDVLDSTGAGDSFAGTFVYGLLKGYDHQRCLRLACVAGAYATTTLGGQAACVSEETLRAYAKEKQYDLEK